MTMVKKVWETKEDMIIVNTATEMRNRGLKSKEALDIAYDVLISQGFTDRTRGAMETRYYWLLRNGGVQEPVITMVVEDEPIQTAKFEVLDAEDIIGSLEKFKNVMISMQQENTKFLTENEQLKKELADALKVTQELDELKQNHAFLLRVIEQARRIVRDEDLEKMDTKFKMARNGDLERIS